jgi:type I restriction enzyme R subunit
VPLLVSEAEIRRRYIDLSLKECGWDDLRDGRELEYEVSDMPLSTNSSGMGYIDYVLWADDGLPLAVFEAKRPWQIRVRVNIKLNCMLIV